MKTLENYLSEYGLVLTNESGKEISRPKDLLYSHTGIILGMNIYSQQLMVFHNHPKSGPAIVSLDEYANGFTCNYTNRPSDDRRTVLLRSFSQLEAGADYLLMRYNCQDATSISRKGVASSEGRSNTMAIVGLLGLAFLVSKL